MNQHKKLKFETGTPLFTTELFNKVFDDFLDKVILALIEEKEGKKIGGIIEAKGYFEKNGVRYIGYDQPYHIHILQGMIPAMFLLEHTFKHNGWINTEEGELYLKLFVLGFFCHDANKLMSSFNKDGEDEKSLEQALKEMKGEEFISSLGMGDFFPETSSYLEDIEYLALMAEHRTSMISFGKSTKLSQTQLLDKLAPYVRIADRIASAGGSVIEYWNEKKQIWEQKDSKGHDDQYQNISTLYQYIKKEVDTLGTDFPPLSYVRIQQNPFSLLSDLILRQTAKILEADGIHTFSFMRDGFLYWGEALTASQIECIRGTLTKATEKGVDVIKLTKVDSQSCNFGFIGDIPFSKKVWEKLIKTKADSFLQIAPNGLDKLSDKAMKDLISCIEQLTELYDLPIQQPKLDDKGKLYLRFSEDWDEDEETFKFVNLFCLVKSRWMNAKINKAWDTEFKEKLISGTTFYEEHALIFEEAEQKVITYSRLNAHFGGLIDRPANILKMLLALVEAIKALEDDEGNCSEDWFTDLVGVLDKPSEKVQSTPIIEVFEHYFDYNGNLLNRNWIDQIASIPTSDKICVFTGRPATKPYKEVNAYGLGARGFTKRSNTTLKNTISYVSDVADAENKARKNFSDRVKANSAIYMDFCESFGGTVFDWNFFKEIAKKKGFKSELSKTNKEEVIMLNKSAQLNQNKFAYELTEVGRDLKSQVFLVRNHLELAVKTGLRTYITSIMGEYRPHKEIFVYEQAPAFIQNLGWNRVHLVHASAIFKEVAMCLELFKHGKNLDTGLMTHYSNDRNIIFQAYYQFVSGNEKSAKSIKEKINNFIEENPLKLKYMSVVSELAEIALRIRTANKNFNQESELFRLALDTMREELRHEQSKEDVIERITGELFKKERLEYMGKDKKQACSDFATKMYEGLLEKEWKGQFPSQNRERRILYQFAYLYSVKVDKLRAQRAEEKKHQKVQDAN
ncbi:hypothetical protein [Sediminitomix flava]|uniref:CRISPR-associated protein Csc3 n=1 Tax=Sediminitomix flava TaxID=379075 RepID=A0A315ZE71_SEDFL|nr:hypothetical protein [Sediminitomix flava]PWJ43865.1 hypothetical protein BC781_101211 [Sediminitomix flava]